jgi:hypothetical protein
MRGALVLARSLRTSSRPAAATRPPTAAAVRPERSPMRRLVVLARPRTARWARAAAPLRAPTPERLPAVAAHRSRRMATAAAPVGRMSRWADSAVPALAPAAPIPRAAVRGTAKRPRRADARPAPARSALPDNTHHPTATVANATARPAVSRVVAAWRAAPRRMAARARPAVRVRRAPSPSRLVAIVAPALCSIATTPSAVASRVARCPPGARAIRIPPVRARPDNSPAPTALSAAPAPRAPATGPVAVAPRRARRPPAARAGRIRPRPVPRDNFPPPGGAPAVHARGRRAPIPSAAAYPAAWIPRAARARSIDRRANAPLADSWISRVGAAAAARPRLAPTTSAA